MLKKLLFILFVASAAFSPQIRAGESYISSQGYFEDESNALDIEKMRSEIFTPYQGMISKGYRPSTFWIKLTVRPSDKNLVLRIRPAFTESIELFDSAETDLKKNAGAKYPWGQSDLQSYSHSFELPSSATERSIFLKVKSSRSYLVDLDIAPLAEHMNLDRADSLLYTGYIVFTFSLALGLLGAWLSNRELVLGIFTIQQFLAFLHTFFLVGYARIFFDKYIDVSLINYISLGLVVVYPFIAILANKLLLEGYGLKPIYKNIFNGLLCSSISVMLLMCSGYINMSLKLNAQLVVIAMTTFILSSFFGTAGNKSKENSNLPIGALQAFYVANCLMWLLSILPFLGIIQGREISLHSFLIYNVISGVIFFGLLQYRAKSILKNETLKSDALKKQAEDERFMREEQGKLMAMLTHEIRTPLSVLKLVIDRKVAGSELEEFANRAVSNIDSIIDKCIQLDQLDIKALKISKSNFEVNNLIDCTMADADSNARFKFERHADIFIFSDVDILRVVISNLFNNAIKYNIPGSEIKVIAEQFVKNGVPGARLSVMNEVGNIDPPDPSKIFDKYYRGPSATKVSGSGLGLFLVKALVQALQGEVEYSIHGKLVTFTVWVPV